jgi:hypothetical protein
MEPIGRKRWQTIEAPTPPNRLRTAQLFANSCHRSLPTPHGKGRPPVLKRGSLHLLRKKCQGLRTRGPQDLTRRL